MNIQLYFQANLYLSSATEHVRRETDKSRDSCRRCATVSFIRQSLVRSTREGETRMSSFHSQTSLGSASGDSEENVVRTRLKALTDGFCADCSSIRPGWASLIRTPQTSKTVPNNVSTIAAFVCYHCAAHHRSLGTHICRVKSCTLDDCK